MRVDASDIALLEVEINSALIAQVKASCGKFISGRGLMNFQCLVLCRRIFHNSASGPPVSTTACTRGMPDKPPRTGYVNPHGSVASFRNVLANTVNKLQKLDPQLVDTVEQNFRSAVWFGPWSEHEIRSAVEEKVAPLRTERCFLMASTDAMSARGARVAAVPAVDLSDEPTDWKLQQVPMVHPTVLDEVLKTGKRKWNEECLTASLPRLVLEGDLEPAETGGQAPGGQPTATIAVLTGDEWREWNRQHTVTGAEGDVKESVQVEKLAALKLCAELTRRLQSKGVYLAKPRLMKRAAVLALSERDIHPRDYNLRDPLVHGLLLAALMDEEMAALRGMAFRRTELSLMTEEGLKEAEAKIRESETAADPTAQGQGGANA